jgi:hypothetical protein
MFNQYDIVRLRTVDRVKFVSGPKGMAATPQGEWIMLGAVDGDLVLTKDETVIRIPVQDVVKVASYDVAKVLQALSGAPVFQRSEDHNDKRQGQSQAQPRSKREDS